MRQEIANPYYFLGANFTDGLDFVIESIGDNPAISDLSEVVADYLVSEYVPNPENIEKNELISLTTTAVNGIIGRDLQKNTYYNGVQMGYISMMLSSIYSIPVDAVGNRLTDIQERIGESGLNATDKAPLFMAIQMGIDGFDYWKNVVSSPGGWSDYLNSLEAVNFQNIPYFVGAGMEGALLLANNSQVKGLIDPPKEIGVDIISALGGGVGAASGYVILKFTPKMQ